MHDAPADPDEHAPAKDWVARVGIAGLLPPRLGGSGRPGEPPTFRDEVVLTPSTRLVLADDGGSIVAPLVAPVVAEGPELRRAVAGDGAFAALADLVRRGERRGPLVPARLAEVPAATVERAIDVDQSNDSVIVGDRLVVKLFPRPSAGPQPGELLAAHLAAVGTAEVPTPYGSVRWERPGARSLLVATVTAYLPGARDGWEWFLDLARTAIDSEERGASLDAAAASGALVARFHTALATPSPVLGPAPVTTAGPLDADRWRAQGDRLLDEALGLLPGPEAERLRARTPWFREAFARFDAAAGTPVQRIHGDLHVGQVLAWDGGHAIADLDGNPLAPAGERLDPEPTARDVAAFVRSLDHLGRIVQHRHGADPAAVDAWVADVRRRFLDAYAATLDDGTGASVDVGLVAPFEAIQACHELVYAMRYLSGWLPIADLAAAALVEGTSP